MLLLVWIRCTPARFSSVDCRQLHRGALFSSWGQSNKNIWLSRIALQPGALWSLVPYFCSKVYTEVSNPQFFITKSHGFSPWPIVFWAIAHCAPLRSTRHNIWVGERNMSKTCCWYISIPATQRNGRRYRSVIEEAMHHLARLRKIQTSAKHFWSADLDRTLLHNTLAGTAILESALL